jgi:hypothetical protein
MPPLQDGILGEIPTFTLTPPMTTRPFYPTAPQKSTRETIQFYQKTLIFASLF